MRARLSWLFTAVTIAIFFALMLLIIPYANADDVLLFILAIEPDELLKLYFDGRTVKV